MLENIPSPNIGPSVTAPVILHPLSNEQVFSSMVSANSAWSSILGSGDQKKIEHSLRSIVVAGSDAGDKSGFSVNETVDDNLEMNET